jgi:hypothetical protein
MLDKKNFQAIITIIFHYLSKKFKNTKQMNKQNI